MLCRLNARKQGPNGLVDNTVAVPWPGHMGKAVVPALSVQFRQTHKNKIALLHLNALSLGGKRGLSGESCTALTTSRPLTTACCLARCTL